MFKYLLPCATTVAIACSAARAPDVLADGIVFTPIVSDGTSVYYVVGDQYPSTGVLFLEKVSPGATSSTRIAALPYPMAQIPKFAIDGTAAYFALNGAVLVVSLGDGTESWLGGLDPNLANTVSPLAIDSTDVFWFRYAGLGSWLLTKTPKDGSAASVIYGSTTPIVHPTDIFVDTSNVYWTVQNTYNANEMIGSVMSVPKSGGATTTWASGQAYPTSLVADGTNLYWTDAGSQEPPLAGTVMTTPLAQNGGVAPTVLATDQRAPSDITVLGGAVTWVSGDGVFQYRDGGSAPLLQPASAEHIQSVTADNTNIYWVAIADDLTAGAIHFKEH